MPQNSPPVLARALPIAVLFALLAVLAWPVRADLYLAVAPAVAGSAAASVVADVASYGLLALVALAGLLALWSLVRDRAAFWRLVCGGVGAISAYAISEAVKLLVSEERPCRVWDVATALACPEVGDWSWPSNHSVLAAAFATACIVSVPRTAWFAVPAALLVGVSRLAAGVHYLHDVASGFALAVLLVSLFVALLRAAVGRLPRTWTSPRLRDHES
ncbi:phosphatase PAP2 family protein [Rhodococcus sp. NPDC076796]|uniref:phosphatase PAP2 family protein n=1 Tax=Rhodococcus sp. NPDC076796 TaxID=3154859 RepID=UPI00344DEEBB